MAAVTVFLEEYDKSPDNDVLNRIICQWRRAEDETREACGLPSVKTHYPGCYFYTRGHTESERRLLRKQSIPGKYHPMSAAELLSKNHLNPGKTSTILLDGDEDPASKSFDWEAFVASQSKGQGKQDQHGRRLLDYDHVGPWFNYFPMLDVRTEYYYRYSGTQTIPPCYGKWFVANDRRQTNHWRIMKDPIRVSRRQIDEMHRLLRERIAPIDDSLKSCQPDTAAKIFPNSTRVSVARPVQSTRGVHFKVFCECDDWASKWPEDQKWCTLNKMDRLFRQPYNFETDGF